MFKPATKSKSRLRLALEGPSGSGKTYTALRFAHLLTNHGKIAVIDTENGSAAKYVGERPDGKPWAFDVLDLGAPYSPDRYVEAIKAAESAGYDAIVIDSMAHMWSGRGGMLDLVDAKGSNGNSFDGWRKCKPMERKFWDAIVACRIHLIATFRSKTEWVVEERNGKKVPVKIGTKADQREGVEYEFDVALMLDDDHRASPIKTRCPAIDGGAWIKPGADVIDPLRAWLSDGVEPTPRVETPADDGVPGWSPEAIAAYGVKPANLAAFRKWATSEDGASDAWRNARARVGKRLSEVCAAGKLAEVTAAHGAPRTWLNGDDVGAVHEKLNAIKAMLAPPTREPGDDSDAIAAERGA